MKCVYSHLLNAADGHDSNFLLFAAESLTCPLLRFVPTMILLYCCCNETSLMSRSIIYCVAIHRRKRCINEQAPIMFSAADPPQKIWAMLLLVALVTSSICGCAPRGVSTPFLFSSQKANAACEDLYLWLVPCALDKSDLHSHFY